MSLTDEQIRTIYLDSGFTIKEGLKDLKPYVYASARAIESAACAERDKRIAEMEEMNAQLREQNTAVDKACADLEAHIEQLERELETERAVSFRDQVAQLERELEAVRKDAVWRPIETAPKDGTQVLLFYKGAGEVVAKRVSSGIFVPEYPINGIYADVWLCPRGVLTPSQPLMWMPLPPPPDAAKEKP
jgi:hypothetical protein